MQERREHLPSPVRQRTLWSPPLIGMERPVRSFKSFIQTVPPNPGVNSQKPLPPTPSPTSPEAHISSQLVVAPPTNRATIVAPWNEPTEWNWDVPSPIIPPTNAASISTTDQYFPLLPGPSPVTTGIAGGISTEMVDTDEAQQTVSDLEWGTMGKRPEPPPRNPSRLSMYGRLSEPSGSASSTASVLRDNQPSLSPGSKSEDYSDQSTTHRSDIGIAAPPDLSYIASYTSKKPSHLLPSIQERNMAIAYGKRSRTKVSTVTYCYVAKASPHSSEVTYSFQTKRRSLD